MKERYVVNDYPSKEVFDDTRSIIDNDTCRTIIYVNSERLACNMVDLLNKYCPNEDY